MRKNPERVAWTVLVVAFVVFCILAAGIPLGIRSYVLHATDDQDSQLQVIEGTVLVQEARKSDLTAVTESMTLRPGDEVLTDDTSWATLDLFERSHLTLYGNTKVRLEAMQAPRFGLGNHPDHVKLDVTGGLVRVGVALPVEHDTRFEVVTPHTAITLEEGSYRIEVTNKGTQVTVVRGQAVVKGNGSGMMVPHGNAHDGRPEWRAD